MTIKIDFGRLFPGLVVLLVGVGLFVLWILLAVFSFFLFFIPALHGVFYFTLYVLAASLVLMVSGALVMLAGVSGWGAVVTGDETGWFGGATTRRARRDRMRIGERLGEVFGLVISFLMILFFIENQVRGTGFFTTAFGPFEQFLFYGPWFIGACVSLGHIAYGRRNAIRPLEMLQAAMLTVAAFWLLSVFPFDFTHLADLMPGVIRPAFFWVSDTVGVVILLLAGVGSLANLVYTSVLYATVRARLAWGI